MWSQTINVTLIIFINNQKVRVKVDENQKTCCFISQANDGVIVIVGSQLGRQDRTAPAKLGDNATTKQVLQGVGF